MDAVRILELVGAISIIVFTIIVLIFITIDTIHDKKDDYTNSEI